MKKSKFSVSLSGSLIAAVFLSAGPVVAASEVTINGSACGSYQSLTLDSGKLTLIGDFNCLAATVPPVTEPPVVPPVVIEPPVIPPVDSGAPAECGVTPQGIVANYSHPILSSMTGSSTNTIGLKPDQIYSFKLNNTDNMRAYGSFSTISVLKASGVRNIVVSECPGDMKPIPQNNQTYNACEFVGGEGRLNWSFSETIPGGLSNCRLDPSKQYYINIKHQDSRGEKSCKAAECFFSYDYNARKLK